MDYRLLEINLISAQNLTTKPGGGRRLHTYAVAWVDPSAKLRTRVDRVGFENPTWNDKFIFRVTPDFLASDSSAVSVEIYSLGYLRDALIGTVRFLVGDAHLLSRGGVPSFAALQIRSPSGSFDGILNIGAVVLADAGRGALLRSPALGFEDLMGKNPPRDRRRGRRRRTQQDENPKSAKRSEKENLEPEERSDDTVLSDDKSGRRMNSILSKLGLQRKDSPLTSLDENSRREEDAILFLAPHRKESDDSLTQLNSPQIGSLSLYGRTRPKSDPCPFMAELRHYQTWNQKSEPIKPWIQLGLTQGIWKKSG
ncbi:hypothetical protein H6P81_012809 [Aristolochia fimbriata]|uniref:C2 domain-containing protein n=1 Tax=Aristolochia fimbriata TaxID=158543 RepID=A0AAV7EFR5_ARIFI|nr:hypothetical protein H6P81_012809 [Aristolochia fimbriata]